VRNDDDDDDDDGDDDDDDDDDDDGGGDVKLILFSFVEKQPKQTFWSHNFDKIRI